MANYRFNINEIFEIAEQIERNGAAFYKDAAKKFGNNPEVKDFLLDLSAQEDVHEKTFSDMLRNVLNNDGINLEDELTLQYLDAVAGQFVFDKSKSKSELTDEMSQRDIFNLAIQKEKDAISFFVSLKNALTSSEDKKTIDLIIKEEQTHLIALKKYEEIF